MESLRTHDLIRLRESTALVVDATPPAWVEIALADAPWVVVRRAPLRGTRVPVGVRGATRAQRFAAFVPLAEIVERRSPESLLHAPVTRERAAAIPALAALERVADVIARYGCRGGPGGSVGFELASGVETARAESDLDLVLRHPESLTRDRARALRDALVVAAAPVRVDAILETPIGTVSLLEFTSDSERVVVRTQDGPLLLCTDPWTMGMSVALDHAP